MLNQKNTDRALDRWSTGGGLPPDNKDDRQVAADSPQSRNGRKRNSRIMA